MEALLSLPVGFFCVDENNNNRIFKYISSHFLLTFISKWSRFLLHQLGHWLSIKYDAMMIMIIILITTTTTTTHHYHVTLRLAFVDADETGDVDRGNRQEKEEEKKRVGLGLLENR